MRGKITLFLLFSAFLLTMCKNYTNEPSTYRNGLSCRNYINYRFFEWRGEKYNFYVSEEGADCSYVCPDGRTKQTNISGSVSQLYAASVEELDAQFCGVPIPPTPTALEPLLTAFPVSTGTPTATPASTLIATATTRISPTAMLPSVTEAPVLAGTVSMCDLGGKLINFRILATAPDLTGKTLNVQIAEQESTCYVNPTNPSLLTCIIPNDISFPARIVVTLDGALVNDFEYSGLGCTVLTTPTPAKPPRSYP